MKFQPLNGHVQIKPIEVDDFIKSLKTQYEEVGVVISMDPEVIGLGINIGDKVYFDSYMCSKYPNGDDFYWLVPADQIKAREYDR